MIADRIIMLLIAFVVIYAGATVLWTLNPLIAVLFMIAGVYLIVKTLGSG